MMPNNPSSPTRPTRTSDCNRYAMAGFAAEPKSALRLSSSEVDLEFELIPQSQQCLCIASGIVNGVVRVAGLAEVLEVL